MSSQSKTPGAIVLDRCQCGSTDCKVVGASGVWWAECRACGLVSGPHKTVEKAVERWNSTRAAPAEQTPAVGGDTARCMNSDRATVEQGDDAGCGYLGAGNGAPAVGGEVVGLIIRDLCETEPDDDPNAVHVRMFELESILERHVAPLLVEIGRLSACEARCAELESQLAAWKKAATDREEIILGFEKLAAAFLAVSTK